MQLSLVLAFCAGLAVAKPLAARQDTPKLPFKQPNPTSRECEHPVFGPPDSGEGCLGTIEYCRREIFRQFKENFNSKEECLQSRESAPPSQESAPPSQESASPSRDTPKLPFKQPDPNSKECEDVFSPKEVCLGTLKYCRGNYFADFNENFKSAEECLQSRESAPPPRDTPKRPFKQPNPSSKECEDVFSPKEVCLGTLEYCRGNYFADFNENFKSAEECLQSRESAPPPRESASPPRDPSKRPFKQPAGKNFDKCGSGVDIQDTRKDSEDCVGTLKYCRDELYRKFGENFYSEKECLQSREPGPPRPFKQPGERIVEICGSDVHLDDKRRHSENCVGTRDYCRKGYFKEFNEPFETEEECFRSREPSPVQPASPSKPVTSAF